MPSAGWQVTLADEDDDEVFGAREVGHVPRDHDAAVRATERGDLVIGRPGEPDLGDVLGRVLVAAEVLRRDDREHLVEEEPHVR
jgi:hypothetical protein